MAQTRHSITIPPAALLLSGVVILGACGSLVWKISEDHARRQMLASRAAP